MLQKYTLRLLLVLILLATSWTLLYPGLFKIHDFVHAARVAEMARGLTDGQLPVRWSDNFGYGYGMPLFEFYAPLPYFIGAVLWILRVPVEVVIKLLFFIPSVITIITAYKLGRQWFPAIGAVVVAAAIALAPYRAVNLFVRGAVAEAWGMAFFVVSLLGICLVIRQKKFSWLILLTGLTGMVLSHNLTTLMAIPALLMWTVLLLVLEAQKAQQNHTSFWSTLWSVIKRSVPPLAGISILSLGTSAFYWLPALTEKRFTQMDNSILTGYFDFHLHFLYIRQFFQPSWKYGGSNWGPVDDISFFLGYGVFVGSFLSILLFAYALRLLFKKSSDKKNAFKYLALFIGISGIVLYATYLSLQRSLLIWEAIPVLPIIQFPWRFLGISTTLLGLLTALWMLLVARRVQWIGGILLVLLLLTNARYFQPNEYLQNSDDLYYTDSTRIQEKMSGILPDFIPTAMILNVPPTSLFTCSEVTSCPIPTILANRSNYKKLEVDFASTAIVELSTAAFPGWSVQINSIEMPVSVSKNGLIQLEVPAGRQIIEWQFESTVLRTIADIITLVSLLLLIVWITIKYGFSKKSPKHAVN